MAAAPDRRSDSGRDPRQVIAARAAHELHDGEVVNLGIGIPALIARYLPDGVTVHLHTENGLLGVGPPPAPDDVDVELIDASKRPITMRPGAAIFDSAASFAMIRGGHLDAVVLGALQVSAAGDIANWMIPGGRALGVGGAMDLVVGARRVIVTMTARTPDGEPKLVPACTLPLTAAGVVSVVITEHAVFRRDDDGFALTELLDGATLDQVAAETSARYDVMLEDTDR
jgi:3-oxoacid CoA-transferase B subunit